MSHSHFLRVKTLSGKGIISAAAGHNLRTLPNQADTIETRRTPLNIILKGAATPEDIHRDHYARITGAGIDTTTLRKNAVRGIEVIASLPADSTIDYRAYFTACLVWTAANFGGDENIISVVIHLDEPCPHAHFIIAPVLEGALAGSRMMGDRARLQALQASFYEQVSRPFGFTKPTARLRGRAKVERPLHNNKKVLAQTATIW